jgi:translation initiation factor IF-3
VTEKDIIEKIKQAIALFEREAGRVPTIDQLASKLGMDTDGVRKVIRKFLSDSKLEGTSAFQSNLLEILTGHVIGASNGLFAHSLHQRNWDRQVRLIDEDGAQLGILSYKDDLRVAHEKGLDLFLIQPDANPPVARIMDRGRFKFEAEKRARETKRKYHIVDVKEIKMRYEIDDNDYQVKLRHAQKFLNDGDKIKVLTFLRGREIQHKDLAVKLMGKFAHELKDLGMMDREPELEGRTVVMILSPLSRSGPHR